VRRETRTSDNENRRMSRMWHLRRQEEASGNAVQCADLQGSERRQKDILKEIGGGANSEGRGGDWILLCIMLSQVCGVTGLPEEGLHQEEEI
jgi:hypothetical protein